MPLITHWTSKDLDVLPQIEGVRYEIIDGDLYVSTPPCWTSKDLCRFPQTWACATRLSMENCTCRLPRRFVTNTLRVAWWRHWAPGAGPPGAASLSQHPASSLPQTGTSFPMWCWISHQRLQGAEDQAGHLTRAPELVVEVLSPGPTNAFRDREVKLSLYSLGRVSDEILHCRSAGSDDRRLLAGRGTVGACRRAHCDRHADLAALARLQLLWSLRSHAGGRMTTSATRLRLGGVRCPGLSFPVNLTTAGPTVVEQAGETRTRASSTRTLLILKEKETCQSIGLCGDILHSPLRSMCSINGVVPHARTAFST